MEFPADIPMGRSPRRELQGPRPTPLRINKDSHKIKKPPLAPQASQPPQRPPRQPIIIYTVSPKVIHTTPNDFMNLVQRLTGSTASSSSSSSSFTQVPPANDPFQGNTGMVSPAARYATMEKAMSPMGKKQVTTTDADMSDVGLGGVQLMNHGVVLERQGMFQGILSPGPASLSPIPASFFSPPAASSDPGMASFFQDLSPAFHRNFMEGGGGGFILPSPSNFVSPHTQSIDLFNYFLD
ncbi:protein MKS1-like [Lotus japonicus]|uniref:protein MKS1-like n=1 Tax=Lotus japonicus TaxID=34305 RepID=UPI0025837392|nr:protein MKS1-like [Lotus japonicus]